MVNKVIEIDKIGVLEIVRKQGKREFQSVFNIQSA